MRSRRVFGVLAVACLAAHTADAANRYDPRLRFRGLSTAHFDIYFHQGEEPLARRLAMIAEDVSARVARDLGRPRSRVYVILVDQTDLSNGWATPAPYNLIELNAASPRPDSTIGNTDDWLRLVFAHEYAHIVHLEKSRGWIGGLRHVFGAHPALYPNLFLPLWQIEGIATYNESALTGRGRVPAGDFRLMLDRASAAGRSEPLDRAGGGLVDWPSGNTPYLYGAYFHQYLADRYGPESLARLADATAGRVPYFASGAFRKIYGKSLGALWKDFESAAGARGAGPSPGATPLTNDGFTVRAPRFTADGRLFYAISNPHRFPALMEGQRQGFAAREVTAAYGTDQISSAGETLVFDQVEVVRNVGLQFDLYAVQASGGGVRRLTRGARAAEPDVSPDGRRVVCTVQHADRRALAAFDLTARGAATLVPLVSDALTDYSSPRWSPDGTAVVAERRHLGGPSEIVVIDTSTKAVTTVVASAAARNVDPTWLSGDIIVFASDRGGAGFEIYDAQVASGAIRRLVEAGKGAQSPAISPDGRTLVFVGYTARGYDLFSVGLGGATWTDVPPEPTHGMASLTEAQMDSAAIEGGGPYRPWRTLAPRLWTPSVSSDNGELVAGGATLASDALGRHSYTASVGWSASRARPDWQVGYAYDRWWPTMFADVSDDTDPWRSGELRSREVNAGALFPVRRVRWAQAALAAFHASTDEFACGACTPAVGTDISRRSLRFGSAFTAARTFGYSISPEQGGAFSVTTELVRRSLGADGDATAWTVDLRGYAHAFPRHGVIAARVAAAASSGDARVRQTFSASGPGPQTVGFGFGVDAIGLLRGYAEDTVAGPRVVVANLDYRFPLLSVQRGIGTLPFFLRTIHGAVFADAGHAWTRRFVSPDVRTSIGAELSADTVLGYVMPVTLVSGVAWRRDPSGEHRGLALFGRIGVAF